MRASPPNGPRQDVAVLEAAPRNIENIHLAIRGLKLGTSVRFEGPDIEHAKALASRFDDWPPILVERRTSIVVDGVHRLLAANMLGRTTVAVRYFDGTPEDVFVEAVQANVTHGKPLTLAEREAAATKLLGIHHDWSNRLVGHICGLSDKTVGRLRETSADIPQLSVRMGRDGRRRPIDAQPVRDQIAIALKARPDATPEELALSLRTSPTTVRDVRKRLRGEELDRRVAAVTDRRSGQDRRGAQAPVEWRTDRAILALPGGGELAEWLDQTKIHPGHWASIVTEIPIGRIPILIEDAKSRAAEWSNLATSLEARLRQLNRRSP